MKNQITLNRRLLTLAVFLFGAAASAPAYGQYIYSEIESGSGMVWSTSITQIDSEDDYYGVSVYAELYDPGDNVLASGSDVEDTYAEVDLEVETGESGWFGVYGYHWAYDPDEEEWDSLGGTDDYTYVYPSPGGSGPQPQIDGISPQSGIYGEGDGWGAGGGYVPIYGVNFDPYNCACLDWVSFGTVEYVSDTQVNLYFGDGTSVGSYPIQLETSGGQYSNQVTFTIYGDPQPVITSISPSTWQAGQTTTFTITGTGFGTAPSPSITATGIDNCDGVNNCLVTNASDTGMTVAVAVDANAPNESVTVTVTSNGYNGFAFAPQSPGQPQSGIGYAQVQATNCNTPNLNVTSNGSQISAGQTVYVTASPAMPAISAFLSPMPPCTLSGNATFQLSTSYNGGGYSYPSSPISLPVNQTFSVPTNPFYGGQATIAWAYNGVSQQPFAFNILGQNPATGTIQAALGGWAANIGIHESGLQEFANTGIPLKDYAGGYGVMQLTAPAPSEDQKWNWQSNIAAGQALLATDMNNGYSWLQSQIQQWMQWNQGAGNQYVGPAGDYWEGNCCIFSMQGTGTYTYDVAVGLKQYAGAAVNFISWNNTQKGVTPSWSFNPANSQNADIVYQFASCSSLASCQHSGAGHPGDN